MTAEREIRTIVVPDAIMPERIDRYLAGHADLDLSRSTIQNLIAGGLVTIDGETVNKKLKITGGEHILLEIPPPDLPDLSPQDIPLNIVFEDEHLAVINKQPGLVVHPAPGNPDKTLVNALLYHFGQISEDTNTVRPGIIHRLDKDTSGLLLVAKNDTVAGKLRRQMANREIVKKYTAVICGHMPDDEGTIDLPVGRSLKDRKKMAVTNINSREAITHYRVVERFRLHDLLEIRLETGRTHQIRVHFSHHHRSILGDPDYGGRQKWLNGIDPSQRKAGKILLDMISRQALHAASLEFIHPMTGEEMILHGDMPGDLMAVIDHLRTHLAR